jgi:tRNA threonylcarbamoyl adenosine modification protein YeaZ
MVEPNTAQLILAVDTSTSVQVGLADDARVVARRGVDDSRRHVEQLTPLISQTLSEAGTSPAELTKIICGVGPGPFTGLRVGIATARTLGFALNVPVRGVCSLDVLAAQWLATNPPDGEFVVCTDARRREVYWARYRVGDARPAGRRLEGPVVTPPDAVPALPTGGPAAATESMITSDPAAPAILDAGALALIGDRLPDAGIEPLYLRSPDADPPRGRKSVLARGKRLQPKALS